MAERHPAPFALHPIRAGRREGHPPSGECFTRWPRPRPPQSASQAMSGDNPAGGPVPPPAQGGFDIAAIREQVARETLVQANIANPLLLVSEDRLRLRLQQFE